MTKFWRVVPDNGYIMHAVRGDFRSNTRQRAGTWANLTYGPTLCGLRGRDSGAYPTLRLDLIRDPDDPILDNLTWEEVTAYWMAREPRAFAPVGQVDGIDVYSETERVCPTCIRRVEKIQKEEA